MSLRASAAAPGQLLRRHVQRRAEHDAGTGAAHVGQCGDTKVHQLQPAGRQVEHDIAGFDVAVHHAQRMGVGQRPRQPFHQPQHDGLGQQARHARVAAQLAAAQQLHRQPGLAVLLAGAVDGDDVRVRQPLRGLRLGQKALAGHRVFGRGQALAQAQHLQRQRLLRAAVDGQVHGAHRAAPEQAHQLIRPSVVTSPAAPARRTAPRWPAPPSRSARPPRRPGRACP